MNAVFVVTILTNDLLVPFIQPSRLTCPLKKKAFSFGSWMRLHDYKSPLRLKINSDGRAFPLIPD